MANPGRPPQARGVFALEEPLPPAAIVFDTSFVVAALAPRQPFHSACLDFVSRAAVGGTVVYFNRLLEAAWAEMLSALSWSRVELEMTVEEVPKLMQGYGLASYDAVHVATALVVGVPRIATLDADFARVPMKRLMVHVPRARIRSFRQVRGSAERERAT